MRILVMTNLYPNPFEMTRATFNRQQVRALAEEHEVRVISPISFIDEMKARKTGKRPIASGRRVRFDGLVVDYPRYFYVPKFFRSFYGHFYRASVKGAFKRALREFQPDVILAPWAFPDGWAAVKLGHAAGIPVVIKVHGCDVRWGLSKNPVRLSRTKEAVREADGVVAVSKDLAEICVGFGADPTRIDVLYDGVDATRFHPGPRDEARTRTGTGSEELSILTVASLDPVKGLDNLINACAILKKRSLKFVCRIVGKGPLMGELQQQIEDLDLGGWVEMMGGLPHESLPDWYRSANVFVLPSHSEGVPCVLLEAMTCGVPFVATSVGGVPEVAHMGVGQLVPPGDVEKLADALESELRWPRRPESTPIRSHSDAARELSRILGRHVHEGVTAPATRVAAPENQAQVPSK